MKLKSKPRKRKATESTISGKPGLSHDPEVIEWVRLKIRDGWDRDRIVTASKDSTDGWPRPGKKLTNGGVSECRAAIAAMEATGATNGTKSARTGKKKHDLFAKRRQEKAEGRDNERLYWARHDIIKLVSDLERIDLVRDGIGDCDQDIVADIFVYLTDLSGWVEQSLGVLAQELDQFKIHETIRKLQAVAADESAPDGEREGARAGIKRLQRKLDAPQLVTGK